MSQLTSKKDPLSTQVFPEFMSFSKPWVSVLFGPIGRAYLSLYDVLSRRGKIGSWLVRDHFVFFLMAILGILVLAPRFAVIMKFVIAKYLFGLQAGSLDTSSLPYIYNILVPMSWLSLITFFVERKKRLTILVISWPPLAFIVDGLLDPLSVIFYIMFLGIVYIAIKLPIRRSFAVVIVCVLSVSLLMVCKTWNVMHGRALANLAFFQVTFTPMLWYSVYEELPPKRRLDPVRFLIYHFTRTLGGPVMTYRDIFTSPERSVTQVRFGGVKAIYVALLAAIAQWAIGKLSNSVDSKSLTGMSLLVFSYITYVQRYCQTLIPFNIFIGIARLFGVPIRDNFNYWLLARTPNEHWRRWNILLREWVVTFVFFPIMRAKRWLFVAIMVSLITSGMLHIVPKMFSDQKDWFKINGMLTYWIINGLAIYVVVKVPLLFPSLVEKLGIRTSWVWSVIGVILTSAFYGVLRDATGCENWNEVGDYFSRLLRFDL